MYVVCMYTHANWNKLVKLRQKTLLLLQAHIRTEADDKPMFVHVQTLTKGDSFVSFSSNNQLHDINILQTSTLHDYALTYFP